MLSLDDKDSIIKFGLIANRLKLNLNGNLSSNFLIFLKGYI